MGIICADGIRLDYWHLAGVVFFLLGVLSACWFFGFRNLFIPDKGQVILLTVLNGIIEMHQVWM